MPRLPLSLLSYLRAVAGAWRDDPREDAELLAQFADSGDEAAFKALVYRHGPLVWRSCTQVLGDGPDAEDAFQTAFLALAHQAGRLRREPLAGWLHRVARRAALKTDIEAKRRRHVEHHLRSVTQSEAMDIDRVELYAALDEELARLPERLRIPLVLRYLEGKTLEDVARIVGCCRRVLGKRLTQGEALLREHLKQRGLAVGVGSVAVLLGSSTAASAVPAFLIGSTARAAVAFRSGTLTSGATEAARAVLGAFPSSLETTIMRKSLWIVLACSLGLGGAALVARQVLSARPDELAGVDPGVARTPDEPGTNSRAAARVDCFGDPLPTGALARMGTVRLYYHGRSMYPSRALAFSPDGTTLATPIDGMTVCLWDAATGKEIRRVTTKAARGPIVSLGFSLDGKTLIAMDYHQTICRWETATGKFLRKQKYQGPKSKSVQELKIAFLPAGQGLGFGGIFSPDGKLLATTEKKKQMKDGDEKMNEIIIHLWDVATDKELRQLTYEGELGAVAFSHDGKMLASEASKEIRVWEVASGKQTHQLKIEEDHNIVGGTDIILFSPDSKSLVVGRAGHLLDVSTGEVIRSFDWKDAQAARLSPDGKILVMGDQEGSIRLWEVATGKEIGPRKGYRGPIRSVVYSPDGKTLASMGRDETVRLWEAATGKEIRQLAKHTGWGSGSIAYSPDGKMLVSVDDEIHLWDIATGKEIRQFKGGIPTAGDWPKSAVFSPDGNILAAVLEGDKTIRLWEVATGKQIYTLPIGVESSIADWPVVFSPDGRLLAAPGKENTVSLWEVATGQSIGQLAGPKTPAGQGSQLFVRYLAFSPDSRMLATSSRGDSKIRLWEVATAKEIGQLNGYNQHRKDRWNWEGCSLTFSPDSKMLATTAQGRDGNGDFDRQVHLWEIATGKEIGQLTGHQAIIQTLAFSPDGKTLASGSDDLTCLVWDVTPFASRLKPVLAHTLPARALSQKQLEAAWTDLAKDPATAYAAVGVLQAVPAQAIPLLQARVRPVTPVADSKQLQRWIADLDDNNFTVRDKAERAIEKLGEPAIHALRQALKDRPSVEARRRLKDLLAGLEPQQFGGSPQRMRELRAVHVLEFIGTPEARQVLQTIAKGVAEASLTQDAQAALARLTKRSLVGP